MEAEGYLYKFLIVTGYFLILAYEALLVLVNRGYWAIPEVSMIAGALVLLVGAVIFKHFSPNISLVMTEREGRVTSILRGVSVISFIFYVIFTFAKYLNYSESTDLLSTVFLVPLLLALTLDITKDVYKIITNQFELKDDN